MNDFRDLLWEDYSFSSKELAVKQLSSADFDNRQLLRDTAREEAVQTVSFSAPGSLETLPEGAITETVSAVVFSGSSEKAVSTEYGRNISAESISGKNRSGAVQQEAEEKTITAAPQNTCSDTFKAAFDLTPTILSSGSADPGLLPAAATTAISLSGTDFTAEPEYSVFLLGEGDCSIIGTSDDGKYIVQGANSQYYVGTFYDAEKSTKTSDDNLCWAATASNMLTYTGWGLVNGMKNEDDLLDTFRPYFTNGYWTGKGLEWFFTGKYYDSNTGFYRENGGGGFYSNLTVADVQKNYVTSYFTNSLFPGNENVVASSQFASVLNQYLSQGYACGVSIGWYLFKSDAKYFYGRNGGHAITLWGYTYDSSYSITDPRYLTGLIVSDSDNTRVGNPRTAPNQTFTIKLAYDSSNKAYFTTNYGNLGRVEGFTFLKKSSGGSTVGPVDYAFTVNSNWNRSYTISTTGSFSATIPNLTSDNTIYVGVHIENLGFTNGAATTVKYELRYDDGGHYTAGVQDKSISVSALASGKGSDLKLNLGKLDAGKYVLELSIDPDNKIEEASEKNNTLSIQLIVGYGANYVKSGQTLSNKTLTDSSVYVLNGGTAVSNKVSSGGYLVASSGGLVSATTVTGDGQIKIEKGGTARGTVISSGDEFVEGTASNTKIHASGNFNKSIQKVLSGGVAVSTYLSATSTTNPGEHFYIDYAEAIQEVSFGGIARNTIVGSFGNQLITGSAVGTVLSGGSMSVHSGGVVVSAKLQNGKVTVSSGGVFRNGTINGGKIYAENGGNIYDTTINDGYLYISAGALFNNVTINSGFVSAHEGAILHGLTINAGIISVGDIFEGAPMVNNLTINNKASFSTFRTLSVSGKLNLAGTLKLAFKHTEETLGYVTGVYNGDMYNYNPEINIMLAQRDPGAAAIQWTSYYATMDNGSVPAMQDRFSNISFSITLGSNQASGEYSLMAGATAIKHSFAIYNASSKYLGSVSAGKSLKVGNVTYSLILQSKEIKLSINDPSRPPSNTAYLYINGRTVSSGNVLTNKKVGLLEEEDSYNTTYTASMTVSKGGVASGNTIARTGKLFINDGGIAKNNKLVYWGEEHILSGGKSYNTEVQNLTDQFVSSGGFASGAHLTSNGIQSVCYGGSAAGTIIEGGGVRVLSGGKISNAIVSGGYIGGISVSEGGLAENIEMYAADPNASGGSGEPGVYFNIYGSAKNVTMHSGADAWLAEGSFGENIQIESGGTLKIHQATFSGDIVAAGTIDCLIFNGYVFNAQNADIYLDVSNRKPGDLAIIRDSYGYSDPIDQMEYFQGARFSIIVSEKMQNGTYKLAEYAPSFNGTITVQTAKGDIAGTLTVGGSFSTTYGDNSTYAPKYTYSLVRNGNYGVDLVYDLVIDNRYPAVKMYSGNKVISSGKSLSNKTVNNNYAIHVSRLGVVSSSNVNRGGNIILSSGGTAKSTVINNGGALHVYSGATASGTTVKQGGYFGVGKGAATVNTTIATGGKLTVWNGGVVSSNTINANGAITLSSGAVADKTTINPNGALHVYSGAKASGTTVQQKGYFGVGKGATTVSTTIATGGKLTVWGGGVVRNNTINTNGAIILSSGALADTTVIHSKGALHVYSGATTRNTTVRQSGYLGVGNGATASNTTIAYAGKLTVWGGGLVTGNSIDQYGAIILSSGAIANSTTILAGGGLHIYKGAKAYTTTISSGANLGIGGGGTLINAKLQQGATMTFYKDSLLQGKLSVAGQVKTKAKINASGSIINFDLSKSSAGTLLLDNFANFSGVAQYSANVTEYQKTGTYKLAGNAESFNGSLTLYEDSIELGKLNLSNSLTSDDNSYKYKLSKSNGTLLLSVQYAFLA